PRGVAHNQFRRKLQMNDTAVALLQRRVDAIHDDLNRRGSHGLHGLSNRAQRRRGQGGGAVSSKPMIEHSSGTFTPALVRARNAPNALMSSKAIKAVKLRRRRSMSSVSRQ